MNSGSRGGGVFKKKPPPPPLRYRKPAPEQQSVQIPQKCVIAVMNEIRQFLSRMGEIGCVLRSESRPDRVDVTGCHGVSRDVTEMSQGCHRMASMAMCRSDRDPSPA